ncbi:hypothetical protein ONZ51_g5838 [Trametes cubensis]|uniref:Uncharacterized protein n=1 Tax=Trametes cubensis TaxID=1111947 RepID=A0AAD7TUB6_9APHY|nr:hypothetical protein ONZ51_g5838 [Trametes cubensis]
MPSPSISALINTVSGDLDYTNRKTHQAIYDRIKGHVLPTVSPDDCPPLPLMIYAIRNILEPTLVLSLIPELLKLLAHLEVLRAHAVSLANQLLQSTGDTDSSGQSLDTEDREALVALTKPSRVSAQRTIFRKIIHACCLLHIHNLWRAYDAENDPPLTNHLIDYFPAFFARDPDIRDACATALKERPWHYKITDDELEDNREAGAQAAEFMVNAAQYTDDPHRYCEEHGYDSPGTSSSVKF